MQGAPFRLGGIGDVIAVGLELIDDLLQFLRRLIELRPVVEELLIIHGVRLAIAVDMVFGRSGGIGDGALSLDRVVDALAFGTCPVAGVWSLLHFRGTKVGVMPAKAGNRLSAAPLYVAGFPLSRE